MSSFTQVLCRGHSRPLTELHIVEDGDRVLLASSAHDKMPQIRDGNTGEWIGTFHGHKGAVWSIKIDEATRTLAGTAAGDFSAKLWCLTSGQEIHELKHKHVVKCCDFSRDSMKFATSSQDGFINVYDLSNLSNTPSSVIKSTVATTGAADGAVKVHFLKSNNNLLAAGTKSGAVQLWDLRSSACVITSPTDTSKPAQLLDYAGFAGESVQDLHISDDLGKGLVIGGKTAVALDLASFSVDKVYTMPASLNFKVEGGAALRADGKRFLAGGSDLWLREFDVATGEIVNTFKGHHGPVRCVRYHPSGHIGISGSEDATIRLWELNVEPAAHSNAAP